MKCRGMASGMKAISRTISTQEEEGTITQMGMFSRGGSNEIMLTEKVQLNTLMAQNTKVTGLKMQRQATENGTTTMVHHMKARLSKARSMVSVI